MGLAGVGGASGAAMLRANEGPRKKGERFTGPGPPWRSEGHAFMHEVNGGCHENEFPEIRVSLM